MTGLDVNTITYYLPHAQGLQYQAMRIDSIHAGSTRRANYNRNAFAEIAGEELW